MLLGRTYFDVLVLTSMEVYSNFAMDRSTIKSAHSSSDSTSLVHSQFWVPVVVACENDCCRSCLMPFALIPVNSVRLSTWIFRQANVSLT